MSTQDERKQTVAALLEDLRERIESALECVYAEGSADGSQLAAKVAFERGKEKGYQEGYRVAQARWYLSKPTR